MEEILTILTLSCIVPLFWQIFFAIKCFKHKLKWRVLLIFELITIVIYAISFYYFRSKSGSIFSGYFLETIVSWAALIAYIIMFIITLFIKTILYIIANKNEKNVIF